MLSSTSNSTDQESELRHRNVISPTTSTNSSDINISNNNSYSQDPDALRIHTEENEEKSPTKKNHLLQDDHRGSEISDLLLSGISHVPQNGRNKNLMEKVHSCQDLSSENSDENQVDTTDTFMEKRVRSSIEMVKPTNLDRQKSINNIRPTNNKNDALEYVNIFVEVAVRLLLFYATSKLERTESFKRVIHDEEIWLYKNPMTKDYITAKTALIWIVVAPLVLIISNYLMCRNKKDFKHAISAVTLALAMTAFITSLLKVSVGRPRPDFFYRCFPDGVIGESRFEKCTGDIKVIEEGRKSFPSGHSSMSFAAFGFMSYYLASKLHVFNERGRGQSWRLCVSLAPMFVALEIAVSRTCDYHHHWQDALVGSLIGICISYLCYRQYFPSIFSINCHHPYSAKRKIGEKTANCYVNEAVEVPDEHKPLIGGDKENKWI